MLSIAFLWAFSGTAEIVLFQIGVDGAWWRFILFLAIAMVYLVPLITANRANLGLMKA